MRIEPRKKLRITVIEDSQNDPVVKVMTTGLHKGSDNEPVRSAVYGPDSWVYKGRVLKVEGAETISEEELRLRIKREVVRHSREMDRIRREVEAFENLDKLPSARREQIPEPVRIFVWQRDRGQCVECGSRERLEFDHIIPVAEGGATTARNIQLLCEPCNRKKGRRI